MYVITYINTDGQTITNRLFSTQHRAAEKEAAEYAERVGLPLFVVERISDERPKTH